LNPPPADGRDQEGAQMTDNPSNPDEQTQSIQFHVPPDLDYVYRDVFNVFVGAGEVVIEFGNRHRAMPQHVTISNRIVVSVGHAYTLIQTLNQALQEAQLRLQKNLQQKSAGD
jgi:hypothetical protein